MKNIYGFKVTDRRGGTIERWFSTSGKLTMPATPELRSMYRHQLEYDDVKEAYKHCRESAKYFKGMKVQELTEADWNNTPNPVKQFFNKIFGRERNERNKV